VATPGGYGAGQVGGDVAHVGAAVGDADRELVAGRALGDALADRLRQRDLAAQAVPLLC
jgi:hypothetical protein